ncbi:MAG: hypothetical protein Q8Q17_01430 [bacterium]|nr:hypothetical protein [bacterium]
MKPERNKFMPALELGTADLAHFLGGQVEVTQFLKKCLYVAEIDRAVIEGSQLRMGLPLVLNGEDYPPFPRRWVRDDGRNSCVLELGEYIVADIGPGMEGGGDRWFLHSPGGFDSAILYPKNGRKFDQRVVGLLAPPIGELSGPPEVKGISVE